MAPAASLRSVDPLEKLANDFGVSASDVGVLSVMAGAGQGFLSMPKAQRDRVRDASQRIWTILGDHTSRILYDKIKAVAP